MNEYLAEVMADIESGKLNTGELINDAIEMVRYKTGYRELSPKDESRIEVLKLYAKGNLW